MAAIPADRSRHELHDLGWTMLPVHNGFPEWEVFTLVEAAHAKHSAQIIKLLQELSHLELEGDLENSVHGGNRAGALVASMVTKKIKDDGLLVTATHPAIHEDTWEACGARYYVSLMPEMAQRFREGAPVPPESIAQLLWPESADRIAPHITEMGWTVVPPNSQPQQVHADIVSELCEPPFARRRGLGRFHHIAWWLIAYCIPVISGAFTEGITSEESYNTIESVRGPCVIIDSEVLHRGGATKSNEWSTTCTVQLSSGRGWHALRSGRRVSPELLELTCEINGRSSSSSNSKRPRTPDSVESGDAVEALCRTSGKWRRCIFESVRADGSCRVMWPDTALSWDGDFSDGLPLSHLRPRPEASADDSGDSAQLSAQRLIAMNDLLSTRGWIRSPTPRELPWVLFDLIEQMHLQYAEDVASFLYTNRENWGSNPYRWGEVAAHQASEHFKAAGIAVYCPPSSQQDAPPYHFTGPRFYVSITQTIANRWPNGIPALPAALQKLMWPSKWDLEGGIRIRGAGWTLAPTGSDPQSLHADIWGVGLHAYKGSKVRWPHYLWQPDGRKLCTTEVVTCGFNHGDVEEYHYSQLQQVLSPAVLIDSEVLHRGAAIGSTGVGELSWRSSCSVEFCSGPGWDAWSNHYTGGTTLPQDEDAQKSFAMPLILIPNNDELESRSHE